MAGQTESDGKRQQTLVRKSRSIGTLHLFAVLILGVATAIALAVASATLVAPKYSHMYYGGILAVACGSVAVIVVWLLKIPENPDEPEE